MEKDIWELEEAWYAYHRDGSSEKAYALVHDQFVGWPAIGSSVVNKAGLIEVVDEEESGADFYEFEFIPPSGIRIIGDTAINHYKIHFAGKNLDGSEIKEVLHVSHTWIKEGPQWKLLSGTAYDVTQL